MRDREALDRRGSLASIQPLCGIPLTQNSYTLISFNLRLAHVGTLTTPRVFHPVAWAFHPLAQAFHPLAQTFHPLARAFHPLTRAFHPLARVFHPLPRAFHPLTQAFHPLAWAFHSLARASQLRTSHINSRGIYLITLSAHPNDNSQLVCPPAGAHTATPASHLGFAPGAHVAGILASMPTFTPTPAAHEGLGLLAAAATASPLKALAPVAISSLSGPGPYNPSASLPAKLVKRILELEFVEMSEISVADADPPQVPDRTHTPALLPVADISVWVECFSMMASILVTRFPDKAAELFAYQVSIVRAEQNYEGKRWSSTTVNIGGKP